MKYVLILAVLTGCFDSIVSDRCASGYSYSGGQCVGGDLPDGGVVGGGDSGIGGDGGAGPDAPTCTADVTSDPDNCGVCGTVCASGICVDSACVDGVVGQIVAIGHDFEHHHAAMARLLGNAVALGLHKNVAVARWGGTSPAAAVTATTAALTSGMQQLGHTWHSVSFPTTPSPTALSEIDVVLVDAQTGDGDALAATAATWQPALDTFLARGGVVVVLEMSGGVSYRFADGAGLYTVGAPVDTSGDYAYVADGADAIAQQVISPYAAEMSSVTMPGAPSTVIANTAGDTIAFHLVRAH